MTTQKSAKPPLLQLSAPQPSSPPTSWLSATLFFFGRGMPQKWRKSKPEIYASFNCCSCMRFKAKAIIVRSCVASPLGTGALDTSALAAPMACNGRMSRKNQKNTPPKKFPWIPQIMACAICRNSRNNFFQVTFQTYRCRPACLEALPLQTLLSWSVAPSQRWFLVFNEGCHTSQFTPKACKSPRRTSSFGEIPQVKTGAPTIRPVQPPKKR